MKLTPIDAEYNNDSDDVKNLFSIKSRVTIDVFSVDEIFRPSLDGVYRAMHDRSVESICGSYFVQRYCCMQPTFMVMHSCLYLPTVILLCIFMNGNR